MALFREYLELEAASDKRLEHLEQVLFMLETLFLSRFNGRICSTPLALKIPLPVCESRCWAAFICAPPLLPTMVGEQGVLVCLVKAMTVSHFLRPV